MRVSLIIPTLNEEKCVGRVLAQVTRPDVDQIIVVDGHSRDNTVREARSELDPKRDLVLIQKNRGYGNAFREGFTYASGDVLIMMDADGSHNPADIPKLLEKIKDGYEYVLASRYASGARSDDDTMIRWVGNRVFTFLTNMIHGTRVSDSLYLFTAITRKGLSKLRLQSSGFEFCTEILVKAHRAGLRFAEVPVIERPRFAGKSKVIALWHGLKILRMILHRYRD